MSVPGGRLQQMSAIKLALLARQLRGNDAEAQALRSEPIAIVGMGCRFPGGGSDPASYWRMLEAGTDAIREVPADRWDWKRFFDADPAAPGKITTRWGGFLDAIDGFDAAFFGIAPREALHMDPQQRLFLEVVCEALEDAGLTRERLAGSRAGVFAASYHSDYAQMIYSARPMIGAHTVTGAAHSVLANRLSYLLDLRGPSVSIDTACSSSLVALHLACQSPAPGRVRFGLRRRGQPDDHARAVHRLVEVGLSSRRRPLQDLRRARPTASCAAKVAASSCSSAWATRWPMATRCSHSFAAPR